VLTLKPCGRGGIGRRIGLKRKLECSPGSLKTYRVTVDGEVGRVDVPLALAVQSE